MNRFQRLVARGQRGLNLILALGISFTLIITGDSLARYISEGFLSTIYYPFFKTRNAVTSLMEVATENRELRKSLVDASIQVSMLEESLRENIRLRDALGFESPPGYVLVPGEVVSVSAEQVPATAVVYHGVGSSVTELQPVINRDGLVGRVVSASGAYATVELLTHPANRVAARVMASREMGIVRYTSSHGLILDNFPVDGTIAVGDTIVTSGLGGVYPPGIRVAIVQEVTDPPDKPYSLVQLRPGVNFAALEELFIMRSTQR